MMSETTNSTQYRRLVIAFNLPTQWRCRRRRQVGTRASRCSAPEPPWPPAAGGSTPTSVILHYEFFALHLPTKHRFFRKQKK